MIYSHACGMVRVVASGEWARLCVIRLMSVPPGLPPNEAAEGVVGPPLRPEFEPAPPGARLSGYRLSPFHRYPKKSAGTVITNFWAPTRKGYAVMAGKNRDSFEADRMCFVCKGRVALRDLVVLEVDGPRGPIRCPKCLTVLDKYVPPVSGLKERYIDSEQHFARASQARKREMMA